MVVMAIVDLFPRCQAKGLYRNPLTGSSMTMTDAMSDGRVLLEIVSKKKIREEKNSYGIITIKITRETRPYTITGESSKFVILNHIQPREPRR